MHLISHYQCFVVTSNQVRINVQRMLDLHKQLAREGNPQVKTILQRQIETTDKQIDGLVYGLYGLTEEEVKIIMN